MGVHKISLEEDMTLLGPQVPPGEISQGRFSHPLYYLLNFVPMYKLPFPKNYNLKIIIQCD